MDSEYLAKIQLNFDNKGNFPDKYLRRRSSLSIIHSVSAVDNLGAEGSSFLRPVQPWDLTSQDNALVLCFICHSLDVREIDRYRLE